MDYQELNTVTKKARYPLPLISEVIDRLRTAKYFTKLDIKDAYHNIRVRHGDEWKTAFRTRYGLFEYTVMPFGLTNAPATFQRWINGILSQELDVCCIAYLDDVLIYSDTLEQHQKDVLRIMKRLKEAGIKLKPTKCEFHKEETEYLGIIIGPERTKVDPVKTEAIKEWTIPRNKRDIQSFIGFCNFYQQFIKEFSRIAKPLYKLTENKVPWDWKKEQQEAFDKLKECLTTAPILRHYDLDKSIFIETDASKYVCARILSQQDEKGTLLLVAYRSKTMTPAECNYDVRDKEFLAIVQAIKEWKRYMAGKLPTEVNVLTDHRNLLTFTTTKQLNRRQVRWMETLVEQPFIIRYQPGKENGKAGTLTRRSGDWLDEEDERKTQYYKTLLDQSKFLPEEYARMIEE